jgi:hypothetical protein
VASRFEIRRRWQAWHRLSAAAIIGACQRTLPAPLRTELAKLHAELPVHLEQHGLPEVDPENLSFVQAEIADLTQELERLSANA